MRYNRTTTHAGIFSGVGAAFWTMFEFFMGWHNEHLETGALTGFVALLFPTAATVWAINKTKKENADQLTFARAILCGISVSAISAAIGVVFFYNYYSAINPSFLDQMRARRQDLDIATQLVTVVIGSFLYGILISAVVGYVLRTRKDAGDD